MRSRLRFIRALVTLVALSAFLPWKVFSDLQAQRLPLVEEERNQGQRVTLGCVMLIT